ncbi:hypothetical protein P8C59_007201 [Phyllachora maydis]|uniref:Rab-GAP TBC domain-containing protein n=1 Tax=Phyllachora maydis TaxID=1825666 RepID=A0AAD9MDZ9_9PEZI|nr:hypothetical protein P8C59_007201 [Phyllachora maydis]
MPGMQSIPLLPPPSQVQVQVPMQNPPSPGTHRLRRLQSAHNLGAKASGQSLIAQQRLQQHQQHRQHPPHQPHPRLDHHRSMSPVRRVRANSDARGPPNTMASGKRLPKRSLAADAMSMERLVSKGPPEGDVEGALESARFKILDQGIKADGDGMSSLRIYVWLILLNAPILETDSYLSLIHRGASPAYSKIRNDTFRTLTTDPLFRRRVSEASLIRLLNAVAWRLHDAREERVKESFFQPLPTLASPSSNAGRPSSRPGSSRLGERCSLPPQELISTRPSSRPATGHAAEASSGSPASRSSRARALTTTTTDGGSIESGATAAGAEPGTYVQGMNVLAAPFLYAARSEAEAFVAFHQLLTRELPGYIRGAMDGVHKGLALVDKVLAVVDPKLSLYLLSKTMSAKIYAFPSVLTLCACTPPLPEVLRLWDFLFAYGPHLNILCIVAQLVIIRTQILNSPSPNKLLRLCPMIRCARNLRNARTWSRYHWKSSEYPPVRIRHQKIRSSRGSAAAATLPDLLGPAGSASIPSPCAQQQPPRAPHTRFACASPVGSCADLYGVGAVPCRNATSRSCYSPPRGQSCCAPDSGYCGRGTYCAPVAGICCAQEEDGFGLPLAWRAEAPRTRLALAATADVASLLVTLPVRTAGGEAAAPRSGAAARCPKAIATRDFVRAMNSGRASELSSNSPPVQDRRWIIMGFAIGAVAVFMASC